MEKSRLSVKIDKKLYDQLKNLAQKEGRSISFLMDKSVENYLKAKKILK